MSEAALSKSVVSDNMRPTRMPQTREISRAVGTMRNTMACKRNVIPLIPRQHSAIQAHHKTHLVPRSMALVNPPVWRDRWNFKSRFSRCSNVSRATRRTARCPTFANTALRSSPNNVAPIRAAPSSNAWGERELRLKE
jgi:hypothetical protein